MPVPILPTPPPALCVLSISHSESKKEDRKVEADTLDGTSLKHPGSGMKGRVSRAAPFPTQDGIAMTPAAIYERTDS